MYPILVAKSLEIEAEKLTHRGRTMANANPHLAGPGPKVIEAFLIDCLKVLAISAVLVGHLTRPDVLFDYDISIIGRASIPLFMIVSGYLAAVSLSRGGAFAGKVFRRYFGLYFVILPSIPLVYFLDLFMVEHGGAILSNEKFAMDLGWRAVARETFQALSFSGEYWRVELAGQGPFSNQALWTLDYLMAYFVATASLYLLRGYVRIGVFMLTFLVAGPTVVLMSPLWWAGVAAFECYRRLTIGGRALGPIIRGSNGTALAMIAMALAAFAAFEWSGLGPAAYAESKTWAGYEWRQYLFMAKRFLWQYGYIPMLFTILVALPLLNFWQPGAPLRRGIRLASRYALPVYVIHFPLLYLFEALIPNYHAVHDAWDPYLLFVATLITSLLYGWFCFCFSKPLFDSLLERLAPCAENFSVRSLLSSWYSFRWNSSRPGVT